MFICPHCPFVMHVEKGSPIGRDFAGKGIGIVAISSNDVGKLPEDSPPSLRGKRRSSEFNFPYLYDETQEVANAYKLTCTPISISSTRKCKLVYRGQLDLAVPAS